MDETTFAKIVKETKPIVLKAVRENLFPDFSFALDDVVQETYFRAYRALSKGSFREESALSSYLYAIARNEAKRINARLIRKGKKETAIGGYSELEQLKTPFIDPTETEFEKKERISDIKKWIEDQKITLSSQEGILLNLIFEGKSEGEIRAQLQISDGNLRVRIHRLRKKMISTPREAVE